MARGYYRKKRAVPIQDNPFWGMSSDALQIKKTEFQRRIDQLTYEENSAETQYNKRKKSLEALTEGVEKKLAPKTDKIFNKLYKKQKSESGSFGFNISFFGGAFMIVVFMVGDPERAFEAFIVFGLLLWIPLLFVYGALRDKFVKDVDEWKIREQALQQALKLLPPNEVQQYQEAKSALDKLGSHYSSTRLGELSELKKNLWLAKSITSKTKDRERKEKLKAFEDGERQGSSKLKTKLMGEIVGDYTCPYCKCVTKKDNLVMDHIIPITDGGKTTLQNCVLVCESCNQKKSAMTLRAFCKKMGFDFNMIAEKLEIMGKKV